MAIPVLAISAGLNIPPYSYRGATQTLVPLAASSQVRRTVNAVLQDVSDSIFRKYASVITANDQQIPEFLFPGATVVVDCLVKLGYKTSGGSPGRPVVGGSSYVDGDYTFYRPQLTMKVVSWTVNYDEWNAITGWTLNLEEV